MKNRVTLARRSAGVLLALGLLLSVCLCFGSCGASDPLTVYRDYLDALEGGQASVALRTLVHMTPPVVTARCTGDRSVSFSISASPYRLELICDSATGSHSFKFVLASGQTSMIEATGTVEAITFTGEELLTFDTYTDAQYGTDLIKYNYRITATGMMASMMEGMHQLLSDADLTLADFDFGSFNLTADATSDEQAPEEDLGGAFSGARWRYAGQMLVLGLGMVLSVLMILWFVLFLFKVFLAEKPTPKTEQDEKGAMSAEAPATSASEEDEALIAVITAAVAATIEDDISQSRAYPGGFRVVSFRRTSGGSGRK